MSATGKRTKNNEPVIEFKSSGVPARKRTEFLDALAESSNVTKAAEEAGITTSQAYKARRNDPIFARAWLSALWEGYVHLEMEVLGRLRDGNLQTEDAGKYDFANAIRLLTAHRDNAARAQAEQRNVSAAEVRASIDRKVDAIRQQVRREKGRTGDSKSGKT